MTFDEAIGVLGVAKMYLLPELEKEAKIQIETLAEEAKLDDLLAGWERAQETDSTKMRSFFAKRVAKKKPKEELRKLSKEKLMELYSDTVGSD
ncbi:hypothetical protein CJU89_3761 [Yarrowia sp. B02]|nr:hypothetical protein CJU89_3761 [Yarrowia sp. B02]